MNAPTPNNFGSANMNYPIEAPEGANGFRPNLAIIYSNFAGPGWNIGTKRHNT